ncbi:MAG: 1-phosphofructokinase [Chloroflexi bacterium]|nr:1-phosphofructokinase [Chloroflexota bacterium]
MIFTVTLNPAVDRVVAVDELVIGDANRVKQARTDPSGKGVNVSRVIRELGGESVAMGFVAGSLGRFIEASLNELGIRDDLLHVPGQTRTNLAIVEEKHHRHTIINEPGPPIEPRHFAELKARLRRQLRPRDWVVMAGSLPPGIPTTAYAELIDLARAIGCETVLDADGEVLARGVESRPTLIKPNLRELQRLMRRRVQADDEVLAAATELRARGTLNVVVSLGAAGAIAIGDDEAWRAIPPRIIEVSALGAGDAMVAGLTLCLSRGEGLMAGLQLGTAAGAATALTPGTELCHREDVDRLLPEVRVERLR